VSRIGAFDREFWRRLGTNAVLDAMWDMVNDYRRMKGLPGNEPRLRRSVVRLIRRALPAGNTQSVRRPKPEPSRTPKAGQKRRK
jgi:hypothetical protein